MGPLVVAQYFSRKEIGCRAAWKGSPAHIKLNCSTKIQLPPEHRLYRLLKKHQPPTHPHPQTKKWFFLNSNETIPFYFQKKMYFNL
jgi:hypothetical protein